MQSKHAAIPAALLLSSAVLTAVRAEVIPPPVPPVLLHYEYWQDQYVQWISNDMPYSMIELDTTRNGDRSKYMVTLTDRAGKRLRFTNLPQAQADGATQTSMRFKPADKEGPGGVSELSFIGPGQKPVFWRFVQGTDLTKQGGGLVEMQQVPQPMLLFRETGAISSEGTALQMGDTVSSAAYWKEVSQPPYFTAYHAARSSQIHTAYFSEGTTDWKVKSSPAALTVGGEWKLTRNNTDECTLRIEQEQGSTVTSSLLCASAPDQPVKVTAERAGSGWLVRDVAYASQGSLQQHEFNLIFSAGVPLEGAQGTDGAAAAALGKDKFASGRVATTADGYRMTFTDPGWLKTKTVQVVSKFSDNTYHITQHTIEQ